MEISERIKEKLAGYMTPRGLAELIGGELEEIIQLEVERDSLIDANAMLSIRYGQQCNRTVHYMNENAELKAILKE